MSSYGVVVGVLEKRVAGMLACCPQSLHILWYIIIHRLYGSLVTFSVPLMHKINTCIRNLVRYNNSIMQFCIETFITSLLNS